jgi:signal transduction histidine kinase
MLRSWHGGQIAQLTVVGRGGAYVIRVYESDGDLHSGETSWWLLLGGGSIALLLLGVFGGEVLTRRIVRPLIRTAHTAHQLSVGETGARAPIDGPREVGEVGVALNRLADRIDELIAEERETVADLSHRLRTPLTALRLDAEALSDPEDAERIGLHVSALERMLTAVIRAARRPQREGRMPSCDATEVVGDRVQFWSALAEDQGRTVTVALPSTPVPVRAAAEDLAAAVDALLENVIAHTPEGIAFAVELAGTGDGAQLSVADDGPGLSDDDVVRGRSDRGSSGLGLDIARRCAEAGGGSMTLGRSPSGGALITLLLKAP